MFKPFVTFLCVAALASAAVAQSVFITLPVANTQVTAGSNLTVQIQQPDSLTETEDVAIVIGAFECTNDECPGAEVLGDVLYSGPYDPEPYPGDLFYQNFTVTIPSQYSGPVQIGVAFFYLLGAYLNPNLQLTNTTIDVVAASGS